MAKAPGCAIKTFYDHITITATLRGALAAQGYPISIQSISQKGNPPTFLLIVRKS